jgi:hypothetical protein
MRDEHVQRIVQRRTQRQGHCPVHAQARPELLTSMKRRDYTAFVTLP